MSKQNEETDVLLSATKRIGSLWRRWRRRWDEYKDRLESVEGQDEFFRDLLIDYLNYVGCFQLKFRFDIPSRVFDDPDRMLPWPDYIGFTLGLGYPLLLERAIRAEESRRESDAASASSESGIRLPPLVESYLIMTDPNSLASWLGFLLKHPNELVRHTALVMLGGVAFAETKMFDRLERGIKAVSSYDKVYDGLCHEIQGALCEAYADWDPKQDPLVEGDTSLVARTRRLLPKAVRQPTSEGLDGLQDPKGDFACDMLEREEELEVFRDALGSSGLSPREQEVLELSRSGLTHSEIAQKLGVAKGAVDTLSKG